MTTLAYGVDVTPEREVLVELERVDGIAIVRSLVVLELDPRPASPELELQAIARARDTAEA